MSQVSAREYWRAQQLKRRLQGQCHDCGEPAEIRKDGTPRSRCVKHKLARRKQ